MKNKGKLWIALSIGLLLFAAGLATASAEESGRFRSKGSIYYQDGSGQEILWDAEDLNILFQYAAEGKRGLSVALGGVGTKLIADETGWRVTRNPQTAEQTEFVETEEQMKEVDFDFLLQALEDSQTLPEEYTESYVLASSDNLTLGRAAWADGSLLRGNNHDLAESYIRGWMEGKGYQEYESVYNEEGGWIGYRGKET